jgi:uracil DNA glycosylase
MQINMVGALTSNVHTSITDFNVTLVANADAYVIMMNTILTVNEHAYLLSESMD